VQQVIVNVDPDGNVKVEAAGVKGQGCQALTRAIEQALGTTTADTKKSEYYQQEQARAGQSGQIGAGQR
jgi:acylphosphatase